MPADRLHKIIASIKSSYIPALILGFGVCYHYMQQPLEETALWQVLFYISVFCGTVFLLVVNQRKPAFFLLWLLAAYISLCHILRGESVDYHEQTGYILLLLLTPLNVVWFGRIGDGKLLTGKNFKLLLLILMQAFIAEQIVRFKIVISPPWILYVGCFLWLLTLIYLLLHISLSPDIKSTAVVYGLIAMFMGINYVDQPMSFTMFFAVSALILTTSAIVAYVYACFRDPMTGVFSRKSYYRQSLKSFPLKYSLGVICVDNYDKLFKAFGREKTDKLMMMIVNMVRSAFPEALLYRFDQDELVMIFKNEDIKQSYEYLENVRRSIAGAVFVLAKDVKLKLTISAGVSEKKRSDVDAEAVLQRTREAVQRAYKFTQNMTSKA